jgi:hypothetical protein
MLRGETFMRTLHSLSIVLGAALAMTAPAAAQNGGILARAFEGTSVVLKMDMPATSDGVTVKPQSASPVDFPAVARAIKANGIGVHRGESMMVTKVVVKDHHIEFQLGGGGFGTFTDLMSMASTPSLPYAYKSQREKDLENQLRYTYDPYDRQRIKNELNDLQRDRARDNAVAASVNVQAQQTAKMNERVARAQSGSRFNLTYSAGIPPGALTPAGVMEALSPYVDFGAGGPALAAAPASAPPGSISALRKGLTVVQVEQLLGPAAKVSQRTEGSMEVSVREYSTADGQQVSAKFVGGVLVDYTITPRG